jgi:hypothetical protein
MTRNENGSPLYPPAMSQLSTGDVLTDFHYTLNNACGIEQDTAGGIAQL